MKMWGRHYCDPLLTKAYVEAVQAAHARNYFEIAALSMSPGVWMARVIRFREPT